MYDFSIVTKVNRLEKYFRIGVFDSGAGGFSVLSSLLKEIPDADFYYIADTLFAPYGELEDEKLYQRAEYCVDELQKMSCDVIVLACNTVTAWSIDKLRSKWSVPLVGVEPYVNIINHRTDLSQKRVGLLVTLQMARSERLKKLLSEFDHSGHVEIIPMPGLASDIEDFVCKGKINLEILGKHFETLAKYDSLILGCTHYPLVSSSIEKLTGAETICPSGAVAKRVKSIAGSIADSCCGNYFNYLDTKQNLWTKRPRGELEKWPK